MTRFQREDRAARRGLRVLFVCLGDFNAPPGGRQIYYFARALVDAGHSTMVLVGGDPGPVDELGTSVDSRVGVGTYRFRLGRLTSATRKLAQDFRPDVIHLYEPRHVPATAALELAKTTKAALCVRYADDDRAIEQVAGGARRLVWFGKAALKLAGYVAPTAWPFAHPRSQRRIIRTARGLDAIAPALAAEIASRTDRPCRCILPALPAVEVPERSAQDRQALGLPEGSRIVLYAGSIFRPHFADFELLLRAFAILAKQYPDVHLVQTGRVADRYTADVLRPLAGSGFERFHRLGFLPTEQDVMRAMVASDVLVQPGAPTIFNRLRLPAKLHDYLLSGRPVVTYAAGLEELLEDGRHALLTRSGDPSELAGALERVLSDPVLAERLGKAGRERAIALFAPRKIAAELDAYYREALSTA